MPSITPQSTLPTSRVVSDPSSTLSRARGSSGLSGAANRIASGLARSLAPNPAQAALSQLRALNRAASQTNLGQGAQSTALQGEAGQLAAKRNAFNRPYLKQMQEKIKFVAMTFGAGRDPVVVKPLLDLINLIKNPGVADYSKKIVSSLKNLRDGVQVRNSPEKVVAFEPHLSQLCDSLDMITPHIDKRALPYTSGSGLEIIVDPNSDGVKAWVDKFTQKIALKTGVLPHTGQPPNVLQKKQIMNAWLAFAGEVEDRNQHEYGALRTQILLNELERRGNGAVSASEVFNQHAAVCRELSLLGAVVFAEFGIPSRIGSGHVGIRTDKPGPHAWIETLDSHGELDHIVDSNYVKNFCNSPNGYDILASGVARKPGHEGAQHTVTYTQHKFYDLVKSAVTAGTRPDRPGLVRQPPMRNLLDLDNLNLAGDEPVPASDLQQVEDDFFQGLQKSFQHSYLSTIEECALKLVNKVVDTNLTGAFNLDSVQKMVSSANPSLNERVSTEEITDLVLSIRSGEGLNEADKREMETWVKNICDSLDAINPQITKKLTPQGDHALSEFHVSLNNEADPRTQVQSIETFKKKLATMTGIYPAPGQSLLPEQRSEIFNAWLEVSSEVKNDHNLEYGELRNALVEAEARRMNEKLGAVANLPSFDPALSRGLSVIGSVVFAEFGIASRLGSGDVHNAGELKREHCWIETLTDQEGIQQLDRIVDSYDLDRNGIATHQTPVQQQTVANFELTKLYNEACKIL